MANNDSDEQENLEIAKRWCEAQDEGWTLLDTAGRGGTAPVFTVLSPDGERALKLLDKEFSQGTRGQETEKRIKKQVEAIGEHKCPHLVQVYSGGRFEERLFLLMNKAKGRELANCLNIVPRERIATILDHVAKACMYLRSKHLCHRDIKSANIFVTEDFTHATLLDVSVARDIDSPVGLGTDHGGQFPVVATSRYSPPEYLFRLIPPGRELWHALDIYQLGGLIQDLIMQQEMFEAEYQESKSNRYRFAWIVATKTPQFSRTDVEERLLFLGRRALDKNWERRSALKLEDFLSSQENRIKVGLDALGFRSDNIREIEQAGPTIQLRTIVKSYAAHIERQVTAHQRESGITAAHRSTPGSCDGKMKVSLDWTVHSDELATEFSTFSLTYELNTYEDEGAVAIDIRAVLGATVVGSPIEDVSINLPRVLHGSDMEDEIGKSCIAVIGELAAKLVSRRREGEPDVTLVG